MFLKQLGTLYSNAEQDYLCSSVPLFLVVQFGNFTFGFSVCHYKAFKAAPVQFVPMSYSYALAGKWEVWNIEQKFIEFFQIH